MSEESQATDPSSGQPGKVVFLSGDLLFGSKIRSAAEASGLAFQLSGNLPEDESIKWVIVDLATRSGVLDTLMQKCETHCPGAKVLAFGPHVNVDRLEKARSVGVANVLTRGQFDQMLPQLFRV